jgi:hypothetical protein
MRKIDRSLLTRLKSYPQDDVRLIVRVTGDIQQAATRLAVLGATILQTFSLTKSVAISCSARTALTVAKQPWVVGMEEDRKVFAQ